ncbi:MAG: hypothetical protein KatS3mg105_1385 [Gemmatales bacterium]|nr:MAG: hypothetical protein KatS3mg105_1385 [Gemmatales bacterium]
MNIVLTCFCLVVSQQNPVDPAPWGYLYQPAYSLDEKPRLPARPYVPQAGDIVLFSNHSLFWDTIFLMAGTTIPFHSGIVVEMPDGEFATLESGRNYNTPYVDIESVMPYFAEWKGQIWVRRRAVPLTAEQSARLTDFALQVNQRPYGLVRLGAQLTPLRSRGPLRTFFIGYPKGPRQKKLSLHRDRNRSLCLCGFDGRENRPSAGDLSS